MAYSGFTNLQLEREFGLRITEQAALFAAAPPLELSARLRELIAENTRLALQSNSEKARSEYIISPIVTEAYRKAQSQSNLFSGVLFDVEAESGLTGFCDYLFTLAPESPFLKAPVIAVVEAKKEDIPSGIPQCFAELIAAQKFNAQVGVSAATLYGAVTNGEVWRFLRLRGTQAVIGTDEYFLNQAEQIVGILVWMLGDAAASRDATALPAS